jgi:hypothetical protein
VIIELFTDHPLPHSLHTYIRSYLDNDSRCACALVSRHAYRLLGPGLGPGHGQGRGRGGSRDRDKDRSRASTSASLPTPLGRSRASSSAAQDTQHLLTDLLFDHNHGLLEDQEPGQGMGSSAVVDQDSVDTSITFVIDIRKLASSMFGDVGKDSKTTRPLSARQEPDALIDPYTTPSSYSPVSPLPAPWTNETLTTDAIAGAALVFLLVLDVSAQFMFDKQSWVVSGFLLLLLLALVGVAVYRYLQRQANVHAAHMEMGVAKGLEGRGSVREAYRDVDIDLDDLDMINDDVSYYTRN